MMRKRFAVFGVLVLFLSLLIPSRAFAWDFLSDGQMWAGDVGSDHCATVHAGEIYDAATYAVGSDPNKISASVRVKLSDPNYGGRFYEYAQTFHKMESWDDYPEWLPAYVGVAQLVSNGLIGDFNIYNSEASSTLYNGAVLDFQRVLAGEDLGGGDDTPSAPVSGEPLVFTGNPHLNSWGNAVSTGNYYAIRDSSKAAVASVDVTNKGGIPVVPAPVTFTISNYGTFSFDSSQYNFYMYVSYWSNNSNDVYFNIFAIPSTTDVNLVSRSNGGGADVWYCNATFSSTTCYSINLRGKYSYSDGSFAVSSFYQNSGWKSSSLSSIGSDYNYSAKGMECIYTYGSGGPASPPPPDGDWPEPETPVTPDPPEQPTPTAPTVTPDNDPTEPVVTWPTSPTVVLPTQPTPSTTPSGLDYTGLLTLINDNLISIDDYVQALNSSFNSFRADFVTAVDSVVDSIRNIYNYLGHLNDILEVHCKHIRDQIEDSVYNLELYIKDLFEWLPRQLDYDAEFNYDDTYVTNLLHRILNKIPGGSAGTPVTYQPNPQADEPGFFDWLLDLWHRFLIDLVSVLPDELGGLVDAFSQLTHYFPFSIPWDLAALLALFEHEPVTPVFDVPWGFGGDEGEIQMVRVDLHVWDDVMEMVRPVFVAGFCIQLALITKELLENFDIHRGGV